MIRYEELKPTRINQLVSKGWTVVKEYILSDRVYLKMSSPPEEKSQEENDV